MPEPRHRIFVKQQPDGGYVADCPHVKGGCSAYGKTRWDAIENLRELLYGPRHNKSRVNIPATVADTDIKIR